MLVHALIAEGYLRTLFRHRYRVMGIDAGWSLKLGLW